MSVKPEQVEAYLAKYRKNRKDKPTDFVTFLLIRAGVGDTGARPYSGPGPAWESPDIWTAAGHPGNTLDVPPNTGGTVTVGKPNTVYAHVWNLGRAPAAQVLVDWHWFNPSLVMDTANAHLIGRARVDLAPRTNAQDCHKLVKCPDVWIPVMENGGHECIVARAGVMGDMMQSTNDWNPWVDRHIGQRNIAVVTAGDDVQRLIDTLDASRKHGTRLELAQVGKEAKMVLALAAPHLQLDPAVKSHVLAEMTTDGKVIMPLGTVATIPPLIMPHTLLNLGAVPLAAATRGAGGPTISRVGGALHDLFHLGNVAGSRAGTTFTPLPHPKKGEAQVLRVTTYRDVQLVGGYTIIIQGAD